MLGGGQVIVQQVLGGTVYAPSNRVPVGTEVTLQISPDEGYSLTNIAIYDNKNNLISNSATFIMPNGDVTVIPSFIELGGTINLFQATGGNISVDKQGFVRQGTLVTVSTSPSSGYYLSNLTVSLPSGSQNITSSKQFTMPNGNVSVSVSWAKNNYNVSITQVAGGTISASRTGSMPWGTTVTVSASPVQYYQVNSLTWNGNAINNGGSFVTPQTNVNITGSFGMASNILFYNHAFTVTKKGLYAIADSKTYSSLCIVEVLGGTHVDIDQGIAPKHNAIRVIRMSDGYSVDYPFDCVNSDGDNQYRVASTGILPTSDGTYYFTIIGL